MIWMPAVGASGGGRDVRRVLRVSVMILGVLVWGTDVACGVGDERILVRTL